MTERASIGRRAFLIGASASFASRTAFPGPSLHVVELALERSPNLPRRCALALPSAGASTAPGPLPLLVLLHGLGETASERAGIDAWLGPYGLRRAWERLALPPVTREEQPYWSAPELSELNASLAAEPFRGLAIACPFLPRASASGLGIGRYARWLEQVLLPAVRERAPSVSRDALATGLSGVSLGGYVSLEVFLQKPELFTTVGTVQGAFGADRAALYARRLAEVASKRRVGAFVSSSSADPYRRANERLYRELSARGVPARISVRRGPHSQAWLREIGSLEMLLWHDRALRGAFETGQVGPP